MDNYEAFLGIGSNVGNRIENLSSALDMLASNPDISIDIVSSLYVTSPVGMLEQPDFYNAAALLHTTLPPEKLLDLCLRIEASLGRQRTVHWGPRTIDIDILLIKGVEMHTDSLIIPHPRIAERAFVLAPLAQIDPDLVLPNGIPVQRMYESISGQSVKKLWESGWESKWRCSDMKQ